ncbi:MAG: GNAT family N-acetyltransferase, partial [Cryobacterium sp.]|nr:GNAT family N-acetyltransferase [Cryobacterium sp.]
GESLVGFCWLKVAGEVGEFYAVGVDPGLQGAGIGVRLMIAGFARLRAQRVRIAELYVEADNLPAMTLYRKFGFEEYSRDVQYRRDLSFNQTGGRQQ